MEGNCTKLKRRWLCIGRSAKPHWQSPPDWHPYQPNAHLAQTPTSRESHPFDGSSNHPWPSPRTRAKVDYCRPHRIPTTSRHFLSCTGPPGTANQWCTAVSVRWAVRKRQPMQMAWPCWCRGRPLIVVWHSGLVMGIHRWNWNWMARSCPGTSWADRSGLAGSHIRTPRRKCSWWLGWMWYGELRSWTRHCRIRSRYFHRICLRKKEELMERNVMRKRMDQYCGYSALTKRRGAARRRISLSYGKKNAVFMFSIVTKKFDEPLPKLEKVTWNLPGFLSLNGTFGSPRNTTRLHRNFRNNIFFGHFIKNESLKNFHFELFHFMTEKPRVDPATQVHLKNNIFSGVRGISVAPH